MHDIYTLCLFKWHKSLLFKVYYYKQGCIFSWLPIECKILKRARPAALSTHLVHGRSAIERTPSSIFFLSFSWSRGIEKACWKKYVRRVYREYRMIQPGEINSLPSRTTSRRASVSKKGTEGERRERDLFHGNRFGVSVVRFLRWYTLRSQRIFPRVPAGLRSQR